MPDKQARPVPKKRLKGLQIDRFALVDEGDNPGAMGLLSKSKEPKHEGEGPAIPPPSLVGKLKAFFTRGSSDKAEKGMPMTTAEILTHDQFHDDFWRIRSAFTDSVHRILDSGSDEGDPGELLKRTVEEFTASMRELTAEVTKGREDSSQPLMDILKSLDNAVSNPDWQTDSQKELEAALAQLESFEPPTEDAVPDTKTEKKVEGETKKSLAEQLTEAGVAEDAQAAILAAAAEEFKVEPAPVAAAPAPEAKTEDDKADAGEDEALKSLPESVRKRLEETEKRAASAEKKALELEQAEKSRGYVVKAKALGVSGVDTDVVAKAMQLAEETEGGEALMTMIKGLAAQAKKGSVLMKSLGTTNDQGVENEAEAELEKAVKARQDAKPDESYHTAYANVLKSRPELYRALGEQDED